MMNRLCFYSLLGLIVCGGVALWAMPTDAQDIRLSAAFEIPPPPPEPPEPPEGEPEPPEPPEAPHQFVAESRFEISGTDGRLLFGVIAVRHRLFELTCLRADEVPDSIMRCYIRRNGTLVARYDVAFGLEVIDGIDPETGRPSGEPPDFEPTPNSNPPGKPARLLIWEGLRRTRDGELIVDEGINNARIDDELFLHPGIADIQAGDELVVSIINPSGVSVKRYKAVYE